MCENDKVSVDFVLASVWYDFTNKLNEFSAVFSWILSDLTTFLEWNERFSFPNWLDTFLWYFVQFENSAWILTMQITIKFENISKTACVLVIWFLCETLNYIKRTSIQTADSEEVYIHFSIDWTIFCGILFNFWKFCVNLSDANISKSTCILWNDLSVRKTTKSTYTLYLTANTTTFTNLIERIFCGIFVIFSSNFKSFFCEYFDYLTDASEWTIFCGILFSKINWNLSDFDIWLNDIVSERTIFCGISFCDWKQFSCDL